MKKRRLAFTLIELLIVIAIIAVLALIAIPNFLEAQTRAKVSRARADMRSIATALEAYFVDNNKYPCALSSSSFIDRHEGWEWWLWFELPDPAGSPWQRSYLNARPHMLTTPIAYMTTRPPVDPFQPVNVNGSYYDISYAYINFLNGVEYIKTSDTYDPAWRDQMRAVVKAPAPLRLNGPGGPVYHVNWVLHSPGPYRKTEYPVPTSGGPWAGTDVMTKYFFYRPGHWNNMERGGPQVYDPTNGTISPGNIWQVSGGGIQ